MLTSCIFYENQVDIMKFFVPLSTKIVKVRNMLNEMETFAKRLRQARVKEKISMEALSRLLNGLVSKQAISKYEAAKMMPSSTILIALADALRVDLDYFFRSFAFDVQEMKVSFRKKRVLEGKISRH